MIEPGHPSRPRHAVGFAVLAPLVLMVLLLHAGLLKAHPGAIEIGRSNTQDLPGGKEADGILADFVLRNDLIEAVISGDSPRRRADMTTNWSSVTPGCLYDLTLRGSDNDQLTLFAPSGQQGDVTYVRILEGGDDGANRIETVVSAASNDGIYKRHIYELREGWRGLLIHTTVRNETDRPRQVATGDRIAHLSDVHEVGGITVGGAIDPADKMGYAYAWVTEGGLEAPGEALPLKPGEEVTYARFLAVGSSPAQAYGLVAQQMGATGVVSGKVTGPRDQGVSTARLRFVNRSGAVVAYPDDAGRFRISLPPDEYEVTVTDMGRPAVTRAVSVTAGDKSELPVRMQEASRIALNILGEDGGGIPCKVQFIGIDGTESPNLGPDVRAHGCLDQYHSETGAFTVQVPPGDYRVIVTRGIEYDHIEKVLRLEPGETVEVEGTLHRVVDTRGWISADFHSHSTPSGDNVCNTDDRIINLAAEHIEFAPTTEHNRIYNWQPHIDKLGLHDELATVAGLELTGSGEHFNAFPFKPDPYAQDGGAPRWHPDPRVNAIALRDFQGPMPQRWVQLNHAYLSKDFIDRDADGREDGGYRGLELLIDGTEVWGQTILADSPWLIQEYNGEKQVRHGREFIWLQMLNRGHRYTGITVSDAHSVHGDGVGGWRSFIPSSTDKPAQIDWKEVVRNAKAGQVLITNGPFLRVRAADGTGPGGSTRAQGSIKLKVHVQCTDWIDIDRIQVLVNGRKRKDLNFTRATHPDFFQDGVVKFDRTIEVPLSQDSHLIVVAYGEGTDLSVGYGSSRQAQMNPCAYTNPIWVDADGGGFTPNGDTLGWDLPVGGKTVEQVRQMLQKTGLNGSE
jgi:Carboxypeptidase regulatory-like domain